MQQPCLNKQPRHTHTEHTGTVAADVAQKLDSLSVFHDAPLSRGYLVHLLYAYA